MTLETMATLARTPSAKVSNFALSSGAANPEDFCNRLDSWLRQTFRYRSEENEIIRTPEFMLTDYETLGYSEGDCDDVATFVCGLSHAVGIPCRLTAIATDPSMELSHVFAECLTGNGWRIIDVTVEPGTVYTCYSVYYTPV